MPLLASALVSPEDRENYQRDGAVCLRGVFTDWIELLREGVEQNLREPGPYAAENLREGDTGRFFDDYCNWQRIPAFQRFFEQSSMPQVAAEAMGSRSAQLFHDHVLIKEPGTSKPTPWHQDSPYYFVSGEQTVSLWLPLDPVSEDNTLRLVAGSHRWPKPLLPVSWLDDSDFYAADRDAYMELPDIDGQPQDFEILQWAMQPGDAVLFDFRTVHGARGNLSANRRRAFSARWVGDDARYVQRPGRTSPPFPGHAMQAGQRLREDWFPLLWPAA